MGNPYLEKLRALKSQKGAVGALSKLPKHSPPDEMSQPATADTGFDSFGSTQSASFSNFPGRYSRAMAALEVGCPELVPADRWRQAAADGQHFLAQWGVQAEALGWTAKDLFGLAPVPDKPHPSYRRMSRYDETGLIWLLHGRPVVALTESTATIESPNGAITVYRRHNKPALGPLGDSLDDFR